MKKKTLRSLFIWGTITFILALVIAFVIFSPMVFTPQQCPSNTCMPGAMGLIIYFVTCLVCFVLNFIAYIGMLVKQAKQQQWGWFVCTFLFGWPCMLVYLIAVPEEAPVHVPEYQQAPQQPYWPS